MKKLVYLVLMLSAAWLSSCKDPFLGQMFVVDDGDDTKITNIAYMEKHPETFSRFLEFLDAANFYNALNDASTTTTVLAPDNQAMEAFLQDRGLSSFDELPADYLRSVAQVHILPVSINEALFIQYVNEGSIATPTLLEDYLELAYGWTDREVTDDQLPYVQVQDSLSIYVNNQAKVLDMARQTVNGMVYTLGSVVVPLIEPIPAKLTAMGGFEILSEAIRQSGMEADLSICRDTLWQENGSFVEVAVNYTLMAVSDEVYGAAGISSVDELEAYLAKEDKYGRTDVPREDPSSVLNRYVRYHLLSGAKTREELTSTTSEGEQVTRDTYLENEILAFQTIAGNTRINGEGSDGGRFLRSNIKAYNGYIHLVDAVLPVWGPDPTVVVWDFCSSTDIVAYVNQYGADNGLGNYFSTPCDNTDKHIDLVGKISSISYKAASTKSSKNKLGFYKSKQQDPAKVDTSFVNDNADNSYLNNLLILNLGYTGWVELTTPIIVKGTYRVELYYGGSKTLAKKFYGPGSAVKFTMDDYVKQHYTWKGWGSDAHYVHGEVLFEKVLFETTGAHTLKAVFMDANAATNVQYFQSWDYLKFIPID